MPTVLFFSYVAYIRLLSPFLYCDGNRGEEYVALCVHEMNGSDERIKNSSTEEMEKR